MTASLQNFYEEYSDRFMAMADKFEKMGLSGPVLMSPGKMAYSLQSTKLLVVKPELKDWPSLGGSVAANMEKYSGIEAAADEGDFPFWEALRAFERVLKNEPGSSAWTSLSKFSFNKSVYNAIYRDEIELFDELLMAELVSVRPDVVVFMTGQENDKRIMHLLEGMRMKRVEGFNFDELMTMHHVFLPRRSFRIALPDELGPEGVNQKILEHIARHEL